LPVLGASGPGCTASRLGSQWVRELVTATLACLTDGNALAPLTELMCAVDAIDSDELRGQIEERGVSELVWWALNSDPDSDPIRLTIRTEAGRRQAAEALDEALPRAPAPAGLMLLDWAHLTGIPVSAAALHRAGVEQLGPVLLQQSGQQIGLPLLRHFPELREGVLSYLDSVAFVDTGQLVTALSAGLGEALGIDLADQQSAGIRRATLVIQVRSGQLDPVTALTRMFPGSAVDQKFLELLWPQAYWSISEAAEILRCLGDYSARAVPVPSWLSATVLADPRLLPAEEAAHTLLCVDLTRYPAVLEELSPPARERARLLAQVDGWINDLTDPSPGQFTPALNQFLDGTSRLDPATRRRAELALLPLLSRLPASREAKILDHSPQIFADYRKLLAAQISGASPNFAQAARSFALLRLLGEESGWRDLDALLLKTVGKWNQRKLAEIDHLLDSQGEVQALKYFRKWSRAIPPGRLRRVTSGGYKVATGLADLSRKRRRK
jgi:hypothetical protein